MTVKLPATILDTNPRASAQKVASVHRSRMYDSVLEEANIIRHKTILFDNPWEDGTREVEKWVGSERWLWQYLEALGNLCQRTDHRVFQQDFEKPFLSGTEKPPLWTRSSRVLKRHMVELYSYDNIDRLEARYNRSEHGRDMRRTLRRNSISYARRNMSAFEYACVNLADDWKGMVPEQFTDDFIRRIIRHYGLYRISAREFLRRNRYNRMYWNVRSVRDVPYKQKVASDRAIAELLRSRRPQEARLHRSGEPIQMSSWLDASALEQMVETLHTFSNTQLGEFHRETI